MGVEELEATSPDVSDDQDGVQDDTALDDGSTSSTDAAEGDKPPSDVLSVVRDAVPAEVEDADPDSPTGDTGSKSSTDDAAANATEPDNENFSDVPFHTHPRFKQLVTQRNEFRTGHQQYEKVQSYLRDNGLSIDEAVEGFRVQALLKRDPVEAWKVLKPIVKDLLTKTGEFIPADLQERVRKGEMTRDAALEVSKARALTSVTETRTQYDQQVERQRQVHEANAARRDAAATWEADARKDAVHKGIDFDALYEDLQKEVLWRGQKDGWPKDPAGVRQRMKESYDAILARQTPRARKPGMTPVTGGRAAANQQRTPPSSVLDIVKAGGASA